MALFDRSFEKTLFRFPSRLPSSRTILAINQTFGEVYLREKSNPNLFDLPAQFIFENNLRDGINLSRMDLRCM